MIKAGFLLLQSVEVEDSFNNFVLDCKPTDDFLLYDYDEEVRTATTVTQWLSAKWRFHNSSNLKNIFSNQKH